jgi:hypothetical protein
MRKALRESVVRRAKRVFMPSFLPKVMDQANTWIFEEAIKNPGPAKTMQGCRGPNVPLQSRVDEIAIPRVDWRTP